MPTASYFGRNSFAGFAKEDDAQPYGTANTTYTVRRPIISCSMLRQVEKVPRNNLMVAGVAGLRKGHYVAADRATGSIELEMTYDNCGYFIHEAMGASSSDTSPTPNVHTYTLADLPAVDADGNTAATTLGLQRGTGQVEVFEGVCFNTATFSCAAGEQMTLSMDMIAQTSAARATAISYVEPTNENLVLHHHTPGSLSWNGQTFELIDFEYKIENGMAERMRLGSKLTKQPVISDFRSVTMTVTFETDDTEGYAKFLADTQSDAEVIFDNGGAAGSSAEREIIFSLNACYMETYEDSVSESGLITASVTFRGEGDGSSGLPLGAMIRVKNVNATAIENG